MKKNNTKHIKTEKAILIEKKIYNSRNLTSQNKNLYKMKLGTYHIENKIENNNKVYSLTFMTEKGVVTFYVDQIAYYNIKLDSLGLLTRNRDIFVSFDLEKIANKRDVLELNW